MRYALHVVHHLLSFQMPLQLCGNVLREERNRMRSSLFYFFLRGWSKPIHHAILFDWYFVSIPADRAERRVHRSKKCSLTICLCIFPHSLGLHIICFFFCFFSAFLQRMTRVVPSQKFNMCVCVCLVVDKKYGHGECNVCTIDDHEELFSIQ